MWGVIPIYLRRNHSISDKAKLLYAELSDSTDESGVCRKSNEELAENLNVGVSSLRKYLYELRDLEIICIDGDGKDRYISFPERMVLVNVVGKEEKKKKKPKEDLTASIVELWNKEIATGRGITMTPNLIGMVTSRCNNYPDEYVLEAVKNRIELVKNSEWHNQKENTRFRNDISLVLRSDKDLEKHGNRGSLGETNGQSRGENIIISHRL